MARRILIIQGHPDPAGHRLLHALAEAYDLAASAAGHIVERLTIAALGIPLLKSQAEFESAEPPPAVRQAQEAIRRADHIVLFFPLWLGGMPAATRGFFEQVLRPGFGHRYRDKGFPEKLLKGRSARLVVTMGMPAFAYRLFYCSHGLRAIKRNMLGFVGFSPIRTTLFGGVGEVDAAKAERWKAEMQRLGREGR
jgi:putative NADPH-quinone reductase